MALMSEKKKELVTTFARRPNDTGSPEVQVALITERVRYLVEHLKVHRKDHHTKKGLLDLISKRKKLLKYLKETDYSRYRDLIKRLGLRK